MGYERNDRRPGGSYSGERGSGQSQGGDRYRPYEPERGYGAQDPGRRDYRGDRFDNRSDGRSARDHGDHDRGFLDRAGDEVRSWFGDEDAEHRRRSDERNDQRYEQRGPRDDYRGDSGYGASGHGVDRAYGAAPSARTNQRRGRDDHEPGYRSWRDRQMDSFDRDYDEYRRENQQRFDSEFSSWRQNREGQRNSLRSVKEHQEVVGSDGEHVGTVDHVRNDAILLAKSDPDAGGRHHSIPSSWIQSVDDKVTISRTAAQAKQHWRDEEGTEHGNSERKAFWSSGSDEDRQAASSRNRSFSGG